MPVIVDKTKDFHNYINVYVTDEYVAVYCGDRLLSMGGKDTTDVNEVVARLQVRNPTAMAKVHTSKAKRFDAYSLPVCDCHDAEGKELVAPRAKKAKQKLGDEGRKPEPIVISVPTLEG